LFHGVSYGLLPEFRLAAILLSVSACLQLPLSTYTGILIGMRRNEITAIAVGLTRIIGAVAAIVATRFTQSLIVLAICIGIPNLVGGLGQMAAVYRLLAEGRAHVRYISRAVGSELLRSCASLTVTTFGMLLVSGLDLTVVGHFDFSAVGYYSIATVLISFFAGLSGAALSALMAPVAALHARQEIDRIRQVVFSATRLTMFANFSLTTAIFLWGTPMLRLWVGPIYAANALPILKILAVAQTIRLTVSPYATMLVSLDEQRKGVAAAIFEALLNLIASILGAMFFGPIGVAWGTLIGSGGGLLWTLVRVMPSVRTVYIKRSTFLRNAVLLGSIPCLPFIVFCLTLDHLTRRGYCMGLTICVIASALLVVRYSPLPLKRSAS